MSSRATVTVEIFCDDCGDMISDASDEGDVGGVASLTDLRDGALESLDVYEVGDSELCSTCNHYLESEDGDDDDSSPDHQIFLDF